MTELHLLGSTDLQGPEPERFQPVLTQPKVLALLCYLALARPRGFHRRDTLLGLLWPELDQARGRGALRKAIYELRQALGADAILSRGGEEVRLNDDVITCDVVAFEEALEAGEVERAVERYRGAFLAGFFLADGAAFEQWVEGERQRLARSYRTGLERLAERAVAQGDRQAAVTWWRRVSEQDPYSTRVALRVMEVLEAAGDRAGALHYAERHAARLREELGAEPAPDVAALADRLRAHPERHATLRTQAESSAATEHFERFTAAIASRYTILRELGAGGMATVYLAADRKHERKVAVKVLRPELAAVLGAERFLQEIKVTANLQHPHILPLHDSGAAVGFLYYVMPYVAGESLRERLNRETQLGVEEAVQLAEGVATALDYAHRQGVIHRDIKPENILLHEGQALVADFGIALAVTAAGGTRLTGTGLSPGTPAYMSPEQAAGDPAVDARSDVYALGCVVYEMLAGEPPFTGPTAQAVLARQALDPVPNLRTIRTTVPEGVVQAVERALAKVPADRFATAAEFSAALTTPSGDIVPAPKRPRARTARRKWSIGALAAAVALVAAASAWWIMTRGDDLALVPNRVVVAPFENQTGDPDLDHFATMVPEWVSQGLVETGLVQIVPTNTVRATIASGSTPRTGVASPVFLALQTGAGIVVSGSYYRDGVQIRFQTQIIDAARDEVIVGLKPVSKPLPSVMLAVDSLRHRVMAEVAQHLNPRWEGFGRGLSRPPSYEAYREYTAGFEAFFRDGDFPEALRRFERAFAMDSTYWGALVWVANVYSSAGDRATADSLLRLVDPYRDELGLIDRKNMEWIEADLTGRDIERRYQSWKELAQILAQITPSSLVMAQLGVDAYMSGRFREAIEVFADVDFAAPGLEGNWGYFRALTEAHHMLGQHRREEARRARRQYPSVLPLLLLEARALAALGRPDDVMALIDESQTLWRRDEGPMTPGDIMREAGLALEVHDQREAAAEVLNGAVEWQRERDDQSGLFMALYAAGRHDEAESNMDTLRFGPRLEKLQEAGVSVLGRLAAWRGDRDEARRLSDELAQADVPPWDRSAVAVWRAEIAAILGERDEAVALLHESSKHGYDLRFHASPDFASLRDYLPYQEFMRPKR
jgi:DNA-binding SARP family transcriptional activator/TolB-like protein